MQNYMEELFLLLGGLGIFLYGIKLMGESLKAYAGDDLRDVINKYTSNPVAGVFAGIFTTVLIQSSSGTTALVISLVRAGLMGLRQAIGVIMGTNIGTTVTAFLLGLAIKEYSLPIMFLGSIIYMFSHSRKKALIGQIIFGFGALFLGMTFMETPLKALSALPEFADMMASVALNPLLGILIGTVLTMVVQSSSATIGILQGLYVSGAFGFPVAISILLGDNIGTTVTSFIASLGGSRDARRAAMAHLLFNIFGTVFFCIFLYVFNFIGAYEQFITQFTDNLAMQIAFTHLFFNVTVTLVLVWFIPQLEYIIKKIIPIKKEEVKVNFEAHVLDEHLIFEAPALALQQGLLSLLQLGGTVKTQIDLTIDFLKNNDKNAADEVIELEVGINALDKILKHFYMELSSQQMSEDDTKKLHSYMFSLNDLERIGDHCENIVLYFQKQSEKKEKMSETAKEEILKMLLVAQSATKDVLTLYETDDISRVGRVLEKERHLDKMERKYYKRHMARIKANECVGSASVTYVDLLSNIERMGDHCENIVQYYTNADQILTEEELEFDLSQILN